MVSLFFQVDNNKSICWMYLNPDQARTEFALNALQRIQMQRCPDRWNSNRCLENYGISIAASGMGKKRYINTQENFLSCIADGDVRYTFLFSTAACRQADINSTKYWSEIRSGPDTICTQFPYGYQDARLHGQMDL